MPGPPLLPAALAGGLGTGATLLGVTITYRLNAIRNKQVYREETALTVAGLEERIWTWDEAGAGALRLDVRCVTLRLRHAGVDRQLRRALAAVMWACWQDGDQQNQLTESHGVNAQLLALRQQVEDAVIADLLREGSRSERLRQTSDVISAMEQQVPDTLDSTLSY